METEVKSITTEDRAIEAAVRAGCNEADAHLTCSYPDCKCKQMPLAIRTALAARWQDIASALKEAEAEIARTISDIVGARASDMMGTAHPRFDEESRKEIARLEAVVARIRAAGRSPIIAEERKS